MSVMLVYPFMPYWIFSGILIIFPSAVISCLLPKKKFFYLRLALIITAGILLSEVSFLLPMFGVYLNDNLIMFSLYLLSFFLIIVCNECSLKMALIANIWGASFWNFQVQLSSLLATLIDKNQFYEMIFMCKIISSIYMLFIMAVVVSNILKKHLSSMNWRYILVSGIFSFAVILFNTISFQVLNSMSVTVYLFQTFSTLCVLLVLYMMVELHYRQEIEKEACLIENLWETERKQYKYKKEQVDLINRKCHDIKYEISALKQMADDEKVCSHVTELKKTADVYSSLLHTGNIALDTILNIAGEKFGKEKIKMNCFVENCDVDFMNIVDMYTLFGNALDNAYEAVRCMPAGMEQWVLVRIYRDKSFLRILIQNPYYGAHFSETGKIFSTKERNGYHGFGIKSMRRVVQKYDGNLNINTADSIFTVNILLPISGV